MATPRRRGPGRPRKAPGALDRERILHAALAQIDAQGLVAFNIRDLAVALGVAPAAVYWHVPSRGALVSGAIGIALGDVALELPDGPWQQRLASLMRRFRDALRRHPQLAPAVASELAHNGSFDAGLVEQVLAALVEAGFDGSALVDAYNVVIAALCGFATLELSTAPVEAEPDWAGAVRQQLKEVDSARHPMLAAHAGALRNRAFLVRWSSGRQVPLTSGFEAWIEVILAGLEARRPASSRARARG